jgi:hypothetical protein
MGASLLLPSSHLETQAGLVRVLIWSH